MKKNAEELEAQKHKQTAAAEDRAANTTTCNAAAPSPIAIGGTPGSMDCDEPGKILENHACEQKRLVQKYVSKSKKHSGSSKAEVSKRRTTALSGQCLKNAHHKIMNMDLTYKWHGKSFASYVGHTLVIQFSQV